MYKARKAAHSNSQHSLSHTIDNSGARSLQEIAVARKLAESDLSNLFSVNYQPQVDLRTGRCSHVEALVRWTDPEIGQVSPALFVRILERMDRISELTDFVVKQVAQDINDWHRNGVPIDTVAVNISANLLSTESAAESLKDLLLSVPVQPKHIVIELTETAMVEHESVANKCLHELHNHGFQIALDDFGTGYSSLAYLLNFPVDVIKIDRCFTSKLSSSVKCQAILKAVVSLADALGLEVVAEGVETAEELRLLAMLGCQFIQGFYFSRALPKHLIAGFIASLEQSAVNNTVGVSAPRNLIAA